MLIPLIEMSNNNPLEADALMGKLFFFKEGKIKFMEYFIFSSAETKIDTVTNSLSLILSPN